MAEGSSDSPALAEGKAASEVPEALEAEAGEGTTPLTCVLLRHGTPVPEEEDAARPLSKQGQEEAAFTAKGVVEYVKPDRDAAGGAKASILHSGKTRAQQTAEAVAAALTEAGWECECE